MIYYLYDELEKDYHDLKASTCCCIPCVEFAPTGDILLIHHRLSDPENDWTEDQIEEAHRAIAENFMLL